MSLASPWIAAVVALFLWWFSTGAILLIVRRADRAGATAHLLSVVWGVSFLVLGAAAFRASLSDPTPAGAYLGFLSALAVWGWIELAFLTGMIAGPNRSKCPVHTREWDRFLRAWGTVAYHEVLLLVGLTLFYYGSLGAEYAFGLWTYAILYVARISAKLNLYLGVPRINTEFVPSSLSHLPSHFRIRKLNWMFPLSITGLSFVTVFLGERLYSATTATETAGFALLTAIAALALLEHWLMILPLPDAKLWRWMLPAPRPE